MTGAPLPEHAFTFQDWPRYTVEDHAVWQVLYRRRMRELADTASALFLEGARLIGLSPHEVPDLTDVNRRLGGITGWRAQPVLGYLEPVDFFRCLSRRVFPTTVRVRSRDQLDYLPEPDIFHDVFGHVPLHADPVFASFLERLGRVAVEARSETHRTWMARFFWFTVEFGLVGEEARTKIYGSGLISSREDARNALGPTCERRSFSLDAVIAQPFEIDRLQDTLFVIDSFDQLFEAASELERRLTARASPAP